MKENQNKNLGRIFNDVAKIYDDIRPAYPNQLIEDVIDFSSISKESRILEVGCGTGQATCSFARRGYAIVGLEPGVSLAALARQNCKNYRVTITEVSFEEYKCDAASFDLMISGQAFHWIDPVFGCSKAGQLLKTLGSIALFWHLDRSQESQFWQMTTPLYQKYLPPSQPPKPALDQHVETYKNTLINSEYFETPIIKYYPWQKEYTRHEYLKLLNTFSDHRALDENVRHQFFQDIGDIIETLGGTITRFYETVFLLSKKVL